MAEAVFAHLVREAGLQDKIEADSAGTGDWHVGQRAHHGTRSILAENGILYEGCGRLIERRDLDQFDYVIAMDEDNLRDVRRMAAGRSPAHIALLMSYAPEAGHTEVPDPYYSGGFGKVYELVHSGCTGLLQAIRREHGL